MKWQLGPTAMRLTKPLRGYRSAARRLSVWRKMVVVWLSLTLVILPLLGGRTVTTPAHAQIAICGGASPNRIFQGCPLGAAYEVASETLVLDQMLDVHQLPNSDRSRVLAWERGALRTLLYGQLLNTIKKAPGARGEEEKAAVNALATRIKQKRVEAAQFALDEYNRWQNNPCNYSPPTGFSYDGRIRCAGARLNPSAAGPIDPPKFEEFQAYGVARAYAVFQDLSVQRQMDQAARAASFFGGLGGAVAAGGIGLAIAASLSQKAIAVIFPFIYGASEFALRTGSKLAVGGGATAAAAGVSATTVAIGGAVLVVVAAIVISVLRGIDVANVAAIPGKLQAKLDEVRNAAPPDLTQLIATDAGLQEVFSNFFIATLPDFPATEPVPAAQASDPQFRVQQEGVAAATSAATINFKSWRDDNQSARLNGGWFINKYREDNLDKERWALQIGYLNWRGEAWTAGRAGAGFLHTKVDDTTQTFESAEIKYLDWNGNKFTASLIVANLEIATLPVVVNRLNNPTGFPAVPTPKTFPVAIVNSGGQPPNTLAVSVNNGASATVTGVTIANLRIDPAGRVSADLAAECAASPATFTLKVTDNANQSKSAPLLVRLSPVTYAFDETGNTLPSTLPDGVVGARYNAFLSPLAFIQTCSLDASVAFTLTSGRLPRGLSFGITDRVCVGDPNDIQSCSLGVRGLVGTPTSGGTYDFTVKMTFGNGDSFSRDYRVNIDTAPAPLPDGALSWWSGERGVADDLNRNQGRAAGGFNRDNFVPGQVGLAFSFNFTSGAVQLPDNFFPFAPASNQPFTFETWFKTEDGGVIFGRQETDPWGPQRPRDYTPGIYVGWDGRLRVQMFWNGTYNPVTSQTLVNDNDFHHVAVSYDGAEQVVYLDGAEMGRAAYTQAPANVTYKYQLGSGFSWGWPAGTTQPYWHNFIGLIDEPTLYGRALTSEEVTAIYAAGSAGKIQITVAPFNPTCAGNNGDILAKALGNSAPHSFAIDRAGTTISDFQPEGVFINLTTGNYNVKIKDAKSRTFTRAVTLSNADPITFNVAPVNPICSGASNGSLTINATGGTGALHYSINGGQSFQSANVFSNLAAGAYNVIVKDNSGCSGPAQSVTLTSPAPITAQVSGGGLIRPGQSATVNVALSGGAATYTVTLNNNGGTRTGNSPLSFTIGPQATTTYIIAAATDAGDCAATLSGSAIITVDGTPPTIVCPEAQHAVTSGSSGAVNYPPLTVNDNQPDVSFTCLPPTGANFPLGVTPVNCTARDAVGNMAACSFTMTARQPRPASKDLIARVRQLVPPLTQAQANGLIGHLEMANTNLERKQTAQACTHLQNFVTQVNTFVTGGQLTAAQGQSLIRYANQIRNAVGCAGSPFPT